MISKQEVLNESLSPWFEPGIPSDSTRRREPRAACTNKYLVTRGMNPAIYECWRYHEQAGEHLKAVILYTKISSSIGIAILTYMLQSHRWVILDLRRTIWHKN